ncbi:MAG TPA: hypothetical protein DDZ80_17405 [Cyanobacteria bacterium UBA8803]|nr:hypothetical protein [Cyanobacteria bacterium UBA9273]HBL60172.1 hypothetical protein [Cyanobacteria bacterium UBA8803]
MNIPPKLAEELKLYLKHRANSGDLEAKTLLTQIEQVANSQTLATVPGGYSPPPGMEMGC